MKGLIDEMNYHERRFGVGHFDLIVIDKGRRSVFRKYRSIFDYFDLLLVGLTARPRDEIDRKTYSLFDLETRVPTDAYALEDAVSSLVPPVAVSVPVKFQREGMRYDDLPDEDKAVCDELEWDEDGNPAPDQVGAGAFNRWLFNADTVDKVLEHVMTRGQTLLAATAKVFASIDTAQAQLDVWVAHYDRPHQGIGMVAPWERFRLAGVEPRDQLLELDHAESATTGTVN